MPDAAPIAVLDTNVVLDWLLFEDPATASLGAAIRSGYVRWQATTGMLQELAHVLPRSDFDRWRERCERVLTTAASWAQVCPARAVPSMAGTTCRDPDDQKFVDLALDAQARWLISRDKALLRLAPVLARHGVLVGPPATWQLG